MGLTSALNTSLTGLSLNETEINVIGDNMANAGTTGFKASTVNFATQLANTLSFGSAPTSTNGGTNPEQVGLGGEVASITGDFSQGSINQTNSPSDLAIQGNGFFVLHDATSGQVYTRNGNFTLDSANELVNSAGQQVMGFGVDNNFNLVPTTLQRLSIPLGSLHLAQQTANVQMGGALSPQGTIASQGTLETSQALTDTSTAAAATGGTLLSNLSTTANPLVHLFNVGNVINFAPSIGGTTQPAKSLTVTATTKVSDLENFINNSLGLQTGGGIPVDADGIPVGVSINASGQILVKGNRGTASNFDVNGAFSVNNAAIPIGFTPTSTANGESTTTTFTIYDSLGAPLNVTMTAYLESQNAGGTTYRYLLSSPSQNSPSTVIGNGTVTFDSHGKISSAPTAQFSIVPAAVSAVNPMNVTFDFSKLSGISSTGSNLNMLKQDGMPPGTLTSYQISNTGVINGVFDNGLTRTLGQVVLAQFPNTEGLVKIDNNDFQQGVASGLPQVTTPGAFGAGTLRAGALEQSNTDIGKSLVTLIVASTNYQGNARVISSVDQLVNVLLTLGR